MKRVATALICGVSLTALIFTAHLTVMHWFSWKDKPMMPNFFTILLLPGYDLAASIPAPPRFQFAIAVAFDCLLFSIPIWLLLRFRYLVTHRSD